MESIPSTVLAVVHLHLKALLYWFNHEMMRRLLVRHHDHFLVCLSKGLDYGPLEKVCAGYHHQSGPGAPATHTVPKLVRALLVNYDGTATHLQMATAPVWSVEAESAHMCHELSPGYGGWPGHCVVSPLLERPGG